MPPKKQLEGSDLEHYKLVLTMWRKERALGRQEFLGFIIATVILVLVSLSGTWWPPLFGILISLFWLAVSNRNIANQKRLYQELENLGAIDADNPLLHIHTFEPGTVTLPGLGDITRLFENIPVVFILVWILGFILSFVT
jgi:hypothetical protein